MKLLWVALGLGVSIAVDATEMARPQLAQAEAATFTARAYLAQGPFPWEPVGLSLQRSPKVDFLVSADGAGQYRNLQDALSAVPAAGEHARRYVIGIAKGTYTGQFCLINKAPVALIGLGNAPGDVRIVGARYAGESKRAGLEGGNPCLPNVESSTYETASTATLAVFSNDVQILNLSIENIAMEGVRAGVGYPPGAGESGGAQAVAIMTQGDRIQLDSVRLLSHQDTLFVRANPQGTGDRVYIRNSLIAGDVDFIFGAGTLVVESSEVLSRAGRRKPGSGGHVLAPSTPPSKRLGFLVVRSRLVGAPGVVDGSISLGRAWDQGVAKGEWRADLSPNGQAVVRESFLGPHLAGWAASTSRRPFSVTGPQANRMVEFQNQPMLQPGSPELGAHAGFEREILKPGDGWAAAEGGTQGGANALPEHVHTVRNRRELLAALARSDLPRIVRVVGRIDLSSDDNGNPLSFEDFRDPQFDIEQYAAAFDPAVWGKNAPAGALEEARRRSARRQSAHVVARVPSRTSVIGVGKHAAIVHGTLLLEEVDNVIIRNIRFSDAYDHFPVWDPKDNASGEWNSDYDNITLRGATHVWVDHCTFDDGHRPDNQERVLLGRPMQRHDGLLDITRQSNWVTVSWNHFRDHDKTTLVGSSDGQVLDEGKLKVTFHHNFYESVRERTPRVRYGQVHVYNNLFQGALDGAYPYAYSIGIGFKAAVRSDNNVWLTPPHVRPSQLVRAVKGEHFSDRGSWHNGREVDFSAIQDESWVGPHWKEAGWTPSLFLTIDPSAQVESLVRANAGAGRL